MRKKVSGFHDHRLGGRAGTKIQELFNPTPVFRSLGHTPEENQNKDSYMSQSNDTLDISKFRHYCFEKIIRSHTKQKGLADLLQEQILYEHCSDENQVEELLNKMWFSFFFS